MRAERKYRKSPQKVGGSWAAWQGGIKGGLDIWTYLDSSSETRLASTLDVLRRITVLHTYRPRYWFQL